MTATATTVTSATEAVRAERPSSALVSRHRVYGIGDVARLCGVAHRTACRWVDTGILPGWKLPGCGDRRVRRADLLGFMQARGMPVPGWLRVERRLLCVGAGPLSLPCGWRADLAADFFDAGLLWQQLRHDGALFDFAAGRAECLSAAARLRARAAADAPFLCCVRYDDEPEPLRLAGLFDLVLAGPLAGDQAATLELADRLGELG